MKVFKWIGMGLIVLVSNLSVAFALNINTASVEELQEMKGVGQTRAEAIVAYREQYGPFAQVDELLEVDGIGEGTLDRNREILTVE